MKRFPARQEKRVPCTGWQQGPETVAPSLFFSKGSPGQEAPAQRREVSTAGLKGGQAEQALAAQSTTLLPPVDIFKD